MGIEGNDNCVPSVPDSCPMPSPAITLRLKRFRRRFGIAAPRVIVRSHLGWQWYAAGLAVLVVTVGSIGWLLAHRGEALEMQKEIHELREQLGDAGDELARLRATAGTEQHAVQMERTTQQQLLSRIRFLESENAALKEDISLFERLVPADGDESSVRIERFRIVPESEVGRYRYRLLLGFQPSKQVREFKGRLQLVATVFQDGRESLLAIPVGREEIGEWFEVKNFLRKEGGFGVPSGAKLRSVEARLLQGDAIRAKRLAQF